jgi:hypothetical protein
MTIYAQKTLTYSKTMGQPMGWKLFETARQKARELRPNTDAVSVRPMGHPMRVPETLIEAQIVALLNKTGKMSYEQLVQQAAVELYRRELRHGAAAIDIGIVGSRLFHHDVIKTILAANGVLWNVG